MVDITPEQGVELAGYPHYPRNNTGAHDPLCAACMYLNNGENEVAMVTLDLVSFSKQHVAKVRNHVEKACGIPGNHVMISCSHTHSGPWTIGRMEYEDLLAGKGQAMEYVDWLITQIVRLIIKAKTEAFKAQFVSGTALCGAESGVGGTEDYLVVLMTRW